ncbi:hypothetical protein [Halomonas ventosae]|uniref:hypothetical protein n=1 Tax=Halomonas ventosae TaxID=229007 RepID=UPI000D04DFF8|nr:hypothetical protein [Halomonas ventosae]
MHDEASLLSDQQLVQLAGGAAFGRGVEYFREGMLVGWNRKQATITADVEAMPRIGFAPICSRWTRPRHPLLSLPAQKTACWRSTCSRGA